MNNIKNTNLIPPSPQIDINSLQPFTRFCCSIGAIPASYLVSMSYEEQLLWLCNYLENTVIPTVNNNGEAVAELQGLYTQLKNYVDNYFTNLDVQTEINNKLDEMAESGELTSIIAPYLDSQLEDMNKRINAISNMSPTVVSSISQMTDTSKMYVLTTNGNWYYYNGSAWTIGGNYQASIPPLQLNNLDYITRLLFNNIIPVTNYANNSNIKYHYAYNNSTGAIVSQDVSPQIYATIPAFPVIKNVEYNINNFLVAAPFCFITDENGTEIQDAFVRSSTDFHNFHSTHDGWAYITLQNVADPSKLNNTMVQLLDYKLNNFIPFLELKDFIILNKSFNSLGSGNNIVYNNIEVGSSKNIKTILQAINSISNATFSNRFNILLDDGVYNEKNLTLPPFVNLIGVSGDFSKCKIVGYNNPDSIDSVISSTSTLNITGTNELKNISITAQNMRYPVHDESNGTIKDWEQLIDNCYIEHLGNQEVIDYRTENSLDHSNVWSACHGWGEGASSGCKLHALNSIFKSVEVPFYVHQPTSTMEKTNIHILENCQFLTNFNYSIYIDTSYNVGINNSKFIIKNSFIQTRLAILQSTFVENTYMVSGCGLVPVYQRPQDVLLKRSFPIFTDYLKKFKASSSINKGTFVYTTDNINVNIANNNTNKKLIVGYTLDNVSAGDDVYVMTGFLQPLNQSWPETQITPNKYYGLDNNGQLVETSDVANAIAISSNYYYKIL